ncbi:uncharacterized protein LOC121916505 [Sceloporus undulatus]|uniref:uncharacterized protein LOC121916505 n=1 Tax=Sceloporus undulatus TaxID=8520 RepID=UPI001C4AFB15|nr:uncharacterized protein LOC121916505 [Sceloporus undulatus]
MFCCVLCASVAQVLAQDNGGILLTRDANALDAATEETGWFKKLFHAAKGLVWSDAPNATQPPPISAPLVLSPQTTQAQAHAHFAQDDQGKAVAKMNFSLRVVNEDLAVAAGSGIYVEGAAIRIEARVQADANLFPKLFVDECYGTDAQHQSQSRRAYVIADNHGCLYASDSDATWFRKEDETIVLTLRVPAFLSDGELEAIYIHCLLTAWSQKFPTSPGKKTCYFDRISSRWKNLDEPSKAWVCGCCDNHCPPEPHPLGSVKAFSGEGRLRREVVGPLLVRKEAIPWFEGRCRTMKTLLLVSVAFVGSCILAALFLGVLLALGLALFRYSRAGEWRRKEQHFHAELQTVAEALAIAEEIEKESTLDYCKLKSDASEKED